MDISSCKIPVFLERLSVLMFLNYFMTWNYSFKKKILKISRAKKAPNEMLKLAHWLKVLILLLFKCEQLLYIQWVIVLIVLCYPAGVKINKFVKGEFLTLIRCWCITLFVCDARNQTQGLLHATQVPHHWATTPAPPSHSCSEHWMYFSTFNVVLKVKLL